MMQDYLPSVLTSPLGSLSMERALKQVKLILERGTDDVAEDDIRVSLDDLDTMLKHIRRG